MKLGKDHLHSFITQLSIEHSNNNVITPFNWQIKLENGNPESIFKRSQYFKLSGEVNTSYLYAPKKKISLRVFGGSFIHNSNELSSNINPGSFNISGHALNDYSYEDYFFDRRAQDGILSRQINLSGGGFKNALAPKYLIGISNKYLATINITSDIPINIPVLNAFKLYFDGGVYAYLPTINEGFRNDFIYSGGIMLGSFEDIFNVYIPLINSKEIQDIYQLQDNFFQRITFSLNLKLFDINRLSQRDDLIYQQ